MSKAVIGWCAAALVVAAACKKDEASKQPDAPADEAGAARPFVPRDASALVNPPVFAYIPADTPVLFAGYEPVPRAFMERIASAFAPFGDMLQREIDGALRDPIVGSDPMGALLKELDGKLSIEGFESLGFKLDARFAFYMIGPSLALRWELRDGKRMAEVLAKLDAATGSREQALGKVTYRAWSEDGAMVAMAVLGNELAVGVLPEAAAPDILPVLFGQKLPEKSIADTDALRDIVAKYGFLGVGAGYYDLRAIARMLTGEGSQLSTNVLRMFGMPEFSDVCKREIAGLAEISPRWVFGYTQLDAKAADMLMIAELRPDLAKGLAAVQVGVPGLAAIGQSEPLFAMGAGVDVGKTIDFARARARAIVESPYQCEYLEGINDAAAELAEEGDVPDVVRNLRGVVLVAQDVQLGGMMPTGSGYALVGIQNAKQAIDMAKQSMPELAGVKLAPDGKPVEVKLPLPVPGPLHAAWKGDWIGMSMGPGMQDRMVQLVNAPIARGGPFLVFAYDYGRYMKLFGDMMGSEMDDPDLAGALDGFEKLFGVTQMDFYFADAGILIKYRLQFR